MTEVSSSYIYNVEVSIDQIDVYDNREIEDFDELETIVQFKMNPNVLLEFTEDEIIEAINCGEKKIKEAHFLMNENQLNNDLECCVIVKKVTKDGEHVVIGSYKPPLPNEYLRNLKSRYDEQQMRNEKSKLRSFSQISSSMNEMAPLKNEMRKSAGTVVYTLKMICFGPRNTRELSICDFEGFLSNTSINSKKRMEEKCLENCRPKKDYDEYIAEINGNSLTIRISKDSPYTVSQIFDACSSNDKLTIKGCDQQIDFKFPNNFSCYQCKKTFGTCKCTGDSHLTEFQKKTSCSGSSYKNSFSLPVIRGNLKYPGRFEDQSILFNVRNDCESKNLMEKYHRMQSDETRNACLQVDEENVNRELSGNLKIPRGIKMCKVLCQNDTDVFVLKLGKKGRSRDGKNREIELEMRTPRGKFVGQKRMETREVQVVEEEFEDFKKVSKKEENEKKDENGSKKKNEVKGTKSITVTKTNVKKTKTVIPPIKRK